MPFGGNDWLALTEEPTLEPEIPICDPHHHLWDRRPARIPYQNYLLAELYADLNSGHNVHSTVFVETNAMYRVDGPEEMRPVGEVEFAQGMAAAGSTGLYGKAKAAAAIVGHANLHLGESEELADLMSPYMNYAIEQFGPDRGMIESNFPPDKVGHSYKILYNAFKRLTKGYSTT